jgi:reactive intermediate/imine deaminase
MTKVVSNPSDLYAPNPAGTYSMSVRAGNLIFTSGQAAKDATGTVVGKNDILVQARQTFENIRRVLAAHGATMDDVVKRTLYLKDIKHLPDVYKVMAEYFTDAKTHPACTCMQVAELPNPDYMLEIEVVAAVKD